MSDDRDQTPAPTQPNPERSTSSFVTGDPGEEDENSAESALEREYVKNPESAVDRVYKKDKDPDERALGSDEGHRSQAPDYEQLLREDETERAGRG